MSGEESFRAIALGVGTCLLLSLSGIAAEAGLPGRELIGQASSTIDINVRCSTLEIAATGTLVVKLCDPAILESIRSSLADSGKKLPQVRLRLSDVLIYDPSITAVRIFLNKPNADAQTSTKDESYVDSFTFFPKPELGKPAGTFVIDLDEALTRALRDTHPTDALDLSVSVVPIGDKAQAKSISVGAAEFFLAT